MSYKDNDAEKQRGKLSDFFLQMGNEFHFWDCNSPNRNDFDSGR